MASKQDCAGKHGDDDNLVKAQESFFLLSSMLMSDSALC